MTAEKDFLNRWKNAMNPNLQLKLSAVVFAVLWTCGMLWWDASLDRVNIIAWPICGIAIGYFWYLTVRWLSRRGGAI